jgi:NAD(P)-dependent dehydrogenase (short-subunit alcohol dehydrogenase family)
MIILTGASGGIGRELIGYLSEIDNVIGLFNKEPISPLPGNSRITYEKLDLLDRKMIETFVDVNKNRLSQITLVHGASIKIDELAMKYEEDAWDRVMGVNLKGNFLLTQALIPKMLEEKWGRIVNLSSIAGKRGAKGSIAYSTSKSALLGMSKTLAVEYGRFNITSNILSLGYFENGLMEKISAELKEQMKKEIPSRKFGDIRNIAHAIEFLMKSEYSNGAVINIDGGI